MEVIEMSISRYLLAATLVLGGTFFLPGTAQAAETYHTCAGFIDSVPATITKQGVWCLSKDLSTNNISGAAITVNTNNVTIDCNDFKVGGLAAGNTSQTDGIRAVGRQNLTVRNCNVRGFYNGVFINGGAGHLVEDNRFDNNLITGVYIRDAENSLVQRNRVFDTGGSPGKVIAYGINASANIFDNIISGVFADGAYSDPFGILAAGEATTVGRNIINGLEAPGAVAIRAQAAQIIIDNNRISGMNPEALGIAGFLVASANWDTACINNVVLGTDDRYLFCKFIRNDMSE